MPLRFEALDGSHDRASFRCGDDALDAWFHKRAGQDQRRNVARVFVAVDGEAIAGFYSLSAFTLGLDEVPQALAAKLPRYDAIPAALIGRLARDVGFKGQGVGELLVADAVRRTLAAAQNLAVFAIVVEAKNAAAANFYRCFGFEPFPLHPARLFLPTSVAAKAFSLV